MANTITTGPSYYRRGNVEVWEFIRDQGLNYHLGNAIKYICRAGFKDSKVDDLKKAIHYLQNELDYTIYTVVSASVGIQEEVPCIEFPKHDCEDYAADFDR